MGANPFSLVMEGLLSLLFPPRCEICSTLQEPIICERCRQAFSLIKAPFCQQCGLPFDPQAETAAHCPECRSEPPAFDAARTAGVYRDGLRRAIHLLKYDGVRALSVPLGQLIAETVERPFAIECLCPVPLHPLRERMRGYNQSLLLAEEVGARWGIPVEVGLLSRVLNTTPQMQLPADERRRNVKGAFTATPEAKGRTIGLVDDVFTTGSTLRECSRELQRAGADRVLVVTIARAIPGYGL
ncbi:MAG: double zinc ribbon domain-containing protein [Armatimonadota bacterium]